MRNNRLQPGPHGRPLFYKLLTSFLAIIVLLVSFNFLSYAFFRSNIQNEIIKYNSQNFQTTVSNFENHIRLIRSIGFGLYFNDKAGILQNTAPNLNYQIVAELRKEIQSTLSNPFLYLNNLIVLIRDNHLVIEKDGTSPDDQMFSRFYNNPDYSLDFWLREMDGTASFQVYKAAPFTEKGPTVDTNKGMLMPILIKNSYTHNFAVIAMFDVSAAYPALHRFAPDDRFMIADPQGKPLFAAGEIDGFDPAALTQDQGLYKQGGSYVFYRKGADTGFWYVNVIPTARISSQIFKLNAILITLLALAVGIGVAASVFFSRKLNAPLAAIIESIQHWNRRDAPRTQIKEFDWIGDKLSDLMKTNEAFHKDLTDKNSLLNTYAYINKLKMIHTNSQELKLPFEAGKPFRLVLFQLRFQPDLKAAMGIEPGKAAYFIKEYIQTVWAECSVEVLTLQMEKDQILSVVFAGEEAGQTVAEALARMSAVFDLDRKWCTFTIALGPVYAGLDDFAVPYEEVQNLIKRRKLSERTQIVAEAGPSLPPFQFSAAEEQEFQSNLLSGQDAAVLHLTRRRLQWLDKKGAPAADYEAFAADVLGRVRKAFLSLQLDWDALTLDQGLAPYDALPACRTSEELAAFLETLLIRACAQIREKKQETDAITDFVIRYFERHYAEDISLDLVADKLNITGAYLSTYFKDKTGVNFSDYLNELRMSKAKELLQTTGLRIQDIAGKVGYQNVNSFIRMFKKVTGMPPGEYRKGANRQP